MNHNHDKTYPLGQVASNSDAVVATDATKILSASSLKQGFLSKSRDTLGVFLGIIPPTLNLFCADSTDDTVPIGTFARASTATRMGPTGLIESVAAGLVRREWNTDGSLAGWLIEEQRTNLLTYSEDFDNAAWSKSHASITPNAAVTPDGTMTADKLVEDNTNNFHHVSRSLSLGASTAYTFTLYAAYAARRYVFIEVFSNGLGSTARFDLVEGTVESVMSGGTVAASATISTVGNSMFRCSVIFTTENTTSSTIFNVQINKDLGSRLYQGDGTSGIYIWGAQLEAGAFPTSYIPTTTAAVTRAADAWSIATSSFGFNANEGTLYAHYNRLTLSAPSNSMYAVSIDDGTYHNLIVIGNNYGGVLDDCAIVRSDVAQFRATIGTSSLASVKKCLSWASNNANCAKNGTLGGSADTSVTIPTVNSLSVGSRGNGYECLNGHVRHLAYFPRRISDSELQAITL